ncbi:MAG TPA: hypothetical protein VGC77_09640 [Rhodopseudomonas sp.]|uniref:hypothetical protein n=1 Tax=Rhodopseudomonas sp. TaxID=1078 RepID=UPI002ED8C6D9
MLQLPSSKRDQAPPHRNADISSDKVCPVANLAASYEKIASILDAVADGDTDIGDDATVALDNRLSELMDEAANLSPQSKFGAAFNVLLASTQIDATINGVDADHRRRAAGRIDRLLYGLRDYFSDQFDLMPGASAYVMPCKTDPRKRDGVATNPPQIIPQSEPQSSREKSALDVVDANIAPVGAEADLLDELCHMKDANDVCGMMNLYDYFIASDAAAQAVMNLPRTLGRAHNFIESECDRTRAKAYLVADFLKDMRPNKHDAERYSEILFNCALAMGNKLSDAVAVVSEIASWNLSQPDAEG